MNQDTVLQRLAGTQTLRSVMYALGVRKKKAIYVIHRLRKKGYVKTTKQPDQTRVYSISARHGLAGISYDEIINKCSPIKVEESAPIIHERVPSIEETLIFAVESKNLRVLLASLALFRKITDWSLLYRLAKERHLERQIGALYDLARKTVRKIPKMPSRFRNNALKKNYINSFLIPNFRSKDFKDIEHTWKVFIPFNRSDLEDYDINRTSTKTP